MFFLKSINIKNEAIKEADKYYEQLKKEIQQNENSIQQQYEEELTEEQKRNMSIFNKVVLTPKQYLDFIYNSGNFKNYLKNILVVKKIDKKIISILSAIMIAMLAFAVLLVILMEHNVASIILALIIVIVAFGIVCGIKKGRSYKEYYNATMSKLMVSILSPYKFEENSNSKNSNYYLTKNILTKEELEKHFSELFDSFNEFNTLLYTSPESNGGMCDLEIFKKVENHNQQTGKTTEVNELIFDGIYIKNNMRNKSNILNKYIIEIREDENLFSALAEDTINSFAHSEKDFTFNVEELNKALDCKIRSENSVGDAIDKTIEVAQNAINNFIEGDSVKEKSILEEDVDPALILQKVITPALEEHFMYLRKRYNSFNMNLASSYISFNVNLKQTLFQKFKAKELFSNGYKNHTQNVTFVKPELFSNDDFEYSSLFPMLEKLFFVHYLNLLYRFALKSNEVTKVELDVMNRFETEINEIMSLDYSEFKDLYKEELQLVASMAKDTYIEIKNR